MSLERTTELELTGFSIELSTDGGKSYGLPLSGDLSERNYEYARTGKEILDGCTNDRYFDPQSFDGEVPKEDGDGNIYNAGRIDEVIFSDISWTSRDPDIERTQRFFTFDEFVSMGRPEKIVEKADYEAVGE